MVCDCGFYERYVIIVKQYAVVVYVLLCVAFVIPEGKMARLAFAQGALFIRTGCLRR